MSYNTFKILDLLWDRVFEFINSEFYKRQLVYIKIYMSA